MEHDGRTTTTPESLLHWCERARELGADRAKVIDTATVATGQWVRMKCLFGCDDLGSHRTCPPGGVPSVAETRELLTEYDKGILLGVGPVVGYDRSDAESLRLNGAALALERELFLAGCYKAWTMGAGPCDICGACGRGEECPTPESARPSMEGCGIDVYATVRKAGWEIDVVRTHESEYRAFALVLVE